MPDELSIDRLTALVGDRAASEDPIAQLAAAAHRLEPGGTLFVAVPNVAGLASRLLGQHWSWYIPPAHIWYFTRPSLRRFLEHAGLDPISIVTREGDAASLFLELGMGLARWARATVARGAAAADGDGSPQQFDSDEAFLGQRLRIRLVEAAAMAFAPVDNIVARAGFADELWATARPSGGSGSPVGAPSAAAGRHHE
jgi:hypothetical protein